MSHSNEEPKITFANIGGLGKQITAIKEMALFPLLYRKFTTKRGIKAPKGVLFHGPPGTGKTLLASALANECSIDGRPMTFISRKGADILGPYVGQSEQQLRQVFQRARMQSPAIIFFDEIDALAPSRNAVSSISGHHHVSVVATLLTEMDGIGTTTDCDIFVIGATNRIDSIDPALRRPGRFDREIRFSLPSCEERVEIIQVHTAKWNPRMAAELIAHLAARTHGHCGADLQAICGETLMCCLRRTHPGMANCEQRMTVRRSRLQVTLEDLLHACSKFVPAAHRAEAARGKCLKPIMEPIFRETIASVIAGLEAKFPYHYLHGDQLADHAEYSPLSVPQLLLTGTKEHGLTSHLAPAILHAFEHLPVVTIDINILFASGAHGTDAACSKAIRRVKECLPCILYVPDVTSWWDIVGESTRRIFCSLIGGIEEGTKLLLVATVTKPYEDMPVELQQVFREGLAVDTPSTGQRERFFTPLLIRNITGLTTSNRSSGDHKEHSSSSSLESSRRSDSPSPPPDKDRKLSTRDNKRTGVRSGRVEKRTHDTQAHSSKRDAEHKSSKRASQDDQTRGQLGDERRVLLQRLVVATTGYPSLPLERVYGTLSARFNSWADHGDDRRLLEELEEVVKRVEKEARDRGARDQHGYDGFFT